MSVKSLVARIEQVFPELPLPDMTLRQAQLSDETLDREISQEEWDATGRTDHAVAWKDIEPAVLIACDAALSHISEVGFVYYIPAYMRLALSQLVTGSDRQTRMAADAVAALRICLHPMVVALFLEVPTGPLPQP